MIFECTASSYLMIFLEYFPRERIAGESVYSVQFSCSVVSDSLQPHGLQYAKLPCLSPTSGVYSNLCPLSWWCHPTTSSSVVPFSSHLWSFPASESFQMSQPFASGSQSIGVSASTSVPPMNTRTDLLQKGLVGSPCSPRDSQESSWFCWFLIPANKAKRKLVIQAFY